MGILKILYSEISPSIVSPAEDHYHMRNYESRNIHQGSILGIQNAVSAGSHYESIQDSTQSMFPSGPLFPASANVCTIIVHLQELLSRSERIRSAF